MNRAVALLPALPALLALLTLGCATDPKAAYVGNYQADVAKAQVPPLPVPGADAQVKNALKGISLKLSADGTFTFTGGANAGSGKWSLEGPDVKLQMEKPQTQTLTLKASPDKKTLTLDEALPQNLGRITLPLVKTG